MANDPNQLGGEIVPAHEAGTLVEVNEQEQLDSSGIAFSEQDVNEAAALHLIKAKREKLSEQGGVMQRLGALKEIVKSKSAEWTGGVSLQKRFDSGEITKDQVNTFMAALNRYFVPTKKNSGASIRCIDGRMRKGYAPQIAKEYLYELGPQIPGGTVGGGISHRLAVGDELEDFMGRSIQDDIKTFAEKNRETGYEAGDHDDEHAGPGKMGCGAVDGAQASQEKINPKNLQTVEGLLKGILGGRYRPDHFTKLVANSAYLLASEGYYEDIETIIEELKAANPDGIENLTGVHNEVCVVINMVKDTTLHRDELSAHFDGKLQAFNYDAWYTIEVAEKLYPDSRELQSRYIHARVGMALATLMHLTDGTIETIIRVPNQQSQTPEDMLVTA